MLSPLTSDFMDVASCSSFDVCVLLVDSSVPTRPASLLRSVTSAVMESESCLMDDLFSVAIVWALVASASRYATSCLTCVADVAGSSFCVAPECCHAAYCPDTEYLPFEYAHGA